MTNNTALEFIFVARFFLLFHSSIAFTAPHFFTWFESIFCVSHFLFLPFVVIYVTLLILIRFIELNSNSFSFFLSLTLFPTLSLFHSLQRTLVQLDQLFTQLTFSICALFWFQMKWNSKPFQYSAFEIIERRVKGEECRNVVIVDQMIISSETHSTQLEIDKFFHSIYIALLLLKCR